MPIRLDSIAVNPTDDAEGVWVDSIAFSGVKYKVRPIDNPDYQNALTAEAQRLMRKFGTSGTPAAEMSSSRGRLLAQFVLRGWLGFDTEYSYDAAQRYLTDLSYRRFTDDVEAASRMAAAVKCEIVEEVAKNL